MMFGGAPPLSRGQTWRMAWRLGALVLAEVWVWVAALAVASRIADWPSASRELGDTLILLLAATAMTSVGLFAWLVLRVLEAPE